MRHTQELLMSGHSSFFARNPNVQESSYHLVATRIWLWLMKRMSRVHLVCGLLPYVHIVLPVVPNWFIKDLVVCKPSQYYHKVTKGDVKHQSIKTWMYLENISVYVYIWRHNKYDIFNYIKYCRLIKCSSIAPLKCVQWVVLLGGALGRMFGRSPQFLFVFYRPDRRENVRS